MQKSEAHKIIISAAKQYSLNLKDKNLLFVFKKDNTFKAIETLFQAQNFAHLCGITLNRIGASEFYHRCLHNRLSQHDYSFREDGNTELKLSILPQIVNIHKKAKMVGDYNESGINLQTEKLVGNVKATLGFKLVNNIYIPNTALREDIRNISKAPVSSILAVLRKEKSADEYEEICYIKKGFALQTNADRKCGQTLQTLDTEDLEP